MPCSDTAHLFPVECMFITRAAGNTQFTFQIELMRGKLYESCFASDEIDYLELVEMDFVLIHSKAFSFN